MLGPIIIKGLSLAAIYFLISFSVTFLYGVGGFPNLVIGTIGLTGAYVTSTIIKSDVNILFAILAGIGISILLGMIIQRFVVEPLFNSVGGGDRGRIFVIYGTFGLSLLLPAILLNIFRSTMTTIRLPRLGTLKILSASITGYELITIGIAILILVLSHIILNKTRAGTQVRGVTQNSFLARLIKINIGRIYLITAAIGGGCAYIGATLWGEMFSLELGSGTLFTLYGFLIAVMGGLGSIYGAFFISLIIGLALSTTDFLLGSKFEYIITTFILIILVIVKPKGVIPTRRDI